jgi:hypothetical protein
MPKKKGKKDKGPPVPVGDLNIFGPLLVIKQVLLKSNSPPYGRRALLPAQQHAPTSVRAAGELPLVRFVQQPRV